MRYFLSHWYQALLWLIIAIALVIRLDGLMIRAEIDLAQADVGRDILIGRHISKNWDGWLATPHSSWAILPSSPLHYWLVAMAYGLTGSVYGAYVIYAFISLVTIWMFSLIGREVAGKFAGIYLGLVAATSPLLLGYATLLSQISLLPVLSSIVLLCIVRYVRRPKSIWLWLVAGALTPMVLLHNSGIMFAAVAIVVCAFALLIVGRWSQQWPVLAAVVGLVVGSYYWGVIQINAVSVVQLIAQVISELREVSLSTRSDDFAQLVSGLKIGIYPGFTVILSCFGLISLFWRWQNQHKQRQALVLLALLSSVGLVGLAPTQSLGGLHEHYAGPWLVVVLVASWGWPWFLPSGWLTRMAKITMVGIFIWWLQMSQALPLHIPDLHSNAAPQSLVQMAWADAIQSGFLQEGFEIWSVIWEQDELVITDWYAGGWWHELEQLADRQLVTIVSVNERPNNIKVRVIGGGVYLICPDDPTVTLTESEQLQTQFAVPPSVIGRQWLSKPTAQCLDAFWQQSDDVELKPKVRTWMLGRVVAPGAKTGGYALIKYHN